MKTSHATRRFEIKRVDPSRWAILHLPLGVALALAIAVWLVWQENLNTAELIFFIVIGLPSVVLALWGVAWLSAQALNVYLLLLGKGPIVEIEDLTSGASRRP